MELLTFGHGTANAAELERLLRGAEVCALVDVRTAPGSRRNPDAARDALSARLPEAGVAYRWEPRLGGWRRARPDTPDTGLRNAAFAGYAAHMRTPEFLSAIDELLSEAALRRTAVMCAESVWWRCHRRLIADHVELVHGVRVRHLMHDGTLRPHLPTPEARLLPGRGALVYDAGQGALPWES
jgi:uncharacterized protein (DUF488 family)